MTANQTASPHAGNGDRRARVGAVLRSARLAWAVALLATGATLLLASWWVPLQRAETARDAVRQAATRMVLHFTTFEGATIERWVGEAKTMATGAYADQLTALFDQDLRSALRERQVRSVGEIIDLFVQDVDGKHAEVFTVVRQTIHNRDTPTPVEDELRIELELRREDEQWRASNVSVLGPSGLTGTTSNADSARP